MNIKQSLKLEELYKRFRGLNGLLKDNFYLNTERMLYNTQLTYMLDLDLDNFIINMDNNLNILEGLKK